MNFNEFFNTINTLDINNFKKYYQIFCFDNIMKIENL